MIKTVDLTKKYGDAFAIRSIDLDLKAGDLFGFIGPNGAGKTTTMRIIATLLEPSWGEAYVCDHSVHTAPKEIRRLVGYMPDFFGVYDDMTVVEYLEFFAAAYRINGQQRRERVNEMLEIVDLEFKRDAFANTLSRGQTQRLGLARTLLHDPQVLLLDEPLSGLDPRARIEMRNLLRKLGEMGKTIIVSSHILPELADVCNKVGIIDRGELKQNAEVTEVIRMVREHVVLVIQPNRPDQLNAIIDLLAQHEKVQNCELGDASIRVVLKPDVEEYSDLPKLLIENNIDLKRFSEEELDLESAFMALTKGTSTRM
ncbi:putative ABC transporter ATP-binding protein YbhF [Stieleria neptunia]|uniref:Putative ABC transporter ATP-binding protein YbhF n=1 Tax=Stieleria neptunia TaxID=2527979 RepID=A0A518I1L9_9BACT|nr:ABC transporter ATP-binding protein [Stieleria neptunia]QDV46927.1 putative ABC transporter ATP-binding protein YbhF [Stieleria neptunia]